jgi:hypothetical protein
VPVVAGHLDLHGKVTRHMHTQNPLFIQMASAM